MRNHCSNLRKNDTTDDVRTRQPAAARADGHSRFGGSTGGSTCAAPDRSILAQGPDGGWWQSLPSRPSPRQPPAPPGLAHGRRDLPPSRPPAAAADPAGATAMGGRYDVGIRSRCFRRRRRCCRWRLRSRPLQPAACAAAACSLLLAYKSSSPRTPRCPRPPPPLLLLLLVFLLLLLLLLLLLFVLLLLRATDL